MVTAEHVPWFRRISACVSTEAVPGYGRSGSLARGRACRVRAHLSEFVAGQCRTELGGAKVDVAGEVLSGFVDGGKCVRSTFMYLGWLCGAQEDDAALRASASLELFHAFALHAGRRHGRIGAAPRAAVRARARSAGGTATAGCPARSERFGESAAVLLGDLCLVWAAQDAARKRRRRRRARAGVAPIRRHAHRAGGRSVRRPGQRRRGPSRRSTRCSTCCRRKSGNYTVRRPLEIGAAMAGCAPEVIDALGGYGAAIGEAFQLRDDLLGMFGSPAVTGKSVGTDLAEHKATSVVVAAHQLADAGAAAPALRADEHRRPRRGRRRTLASADHRQRRRAVDRSRSSTSA